MKWKKITLLTGYDRFFGQTRKPWVSMDVDRMLPVLHQNGYEVEECEFHDIVHRKSSIENAVIFYSFSQRTNLRKYITDIIAYLDNGSNLIVPSQDLLLCHENKGYQELYKKKKGIGGLSAHYLSSKRELDKYEISYPVVLKSVAGSNAKGVFLVSNREELESRIAAMGPGLGLLKHLDFFRRKYLRRKNVAHYPDYNDRIDYYQYRDYITPEECFVLQEYIPDLSSDYRVIAMDDRFYVMQRLNRDNDFRASGAKRFVYEVEFESGMLDFAKIIFEKIHNPFLSMDIARWNDRYYLFEFQALHFGVSAIRNTPGFYRQTNGKWELIREKRPVEEEIADGLIKFLQRQEA